MSVVDVVDVRVRSVSSNNSCGWWNQHRRIHRERRGTVFCG